MSWSFKDRHLVGVGAAACAVCCAAPLVTFLGIAGATATLATLVFAGFTFSVVVAVAALAVVWRQRRGVVRQQSPGPHRVDVELLVRPQDETR